MSPNAYASRSSLVAVHLKELPALIDSPVARQLLLSSKQDTHNQKTTLNVPVINFLGKDPKNF